MGKTFLLQTLLFRIGLIKYLLMRTLFNISWVALFLCLVESGLLAQDSSDRISAKPNSEKDAIAVVELHLKLYVKHVRGSQTKLQSIARVPSKRAREILKGEAYRYRPFQGWKQKIHWQSSGIKIPGFNKKTIVQADFSNKQDTSLWDSRYLSFSIPWFSPSGEEAMIYSLSGVRGWCFSGRLFHYKRLRNGKWKFVKSRLLVAS